MKKIIFVVFVIFLVSSCTTVSEDNDTIKAKKLIDYNKMKFDSLPLSGKVVDGVREIEVKAFQFNWEPENIVVRKGEKLRFIVESIDVPHGFELEGISIPGHDTDELIAPGRKKIIEYTAEDSGAWDLVCSGYCGTGHGVMKGMFIVRE